MRNRIKKIYNQYSKKLLEKEIKDVSNFIQSIVDADITKGKYTRFLIESFLNDKFLEEDLIGGLDSTVGQAVSLFDKYKGRLPIEQRSVYALNPETDEALYQSPGDLWNIVKQFHGELSGKELKKEEQEQIYRETEFIYKDEKTGFQIISPLTKESAQWWGKGTRWCTSADKNNMFWHYTKDAPLLILLMPASATDGNGNGNKLQLWKYEDDIQFMDEADNDVTLEYIEKHWNVLEPICLWLQIIYCIPKNKQVYEDCIDFIKTNRTYIDVKNDIHEKLITQEICELAVKQNGMALEFIPEQYITRKLCQLAIEQNGNAINLIPNDMLDEHLFFIASKTNKNILIYTPKEYRTKKFCEYAIDNKNVFYNIPKEYINYELCKKSILKNAISIKYIPKEYRTKELCELAIKQDGSALRYIPKKYRTKELYELAINSSPYALQYIPQTYYSEKLFLKSINNYPNSLKTMPMNYFDCETNEYKNIIPLIMTSLKQKKISLSNIDAKIINKDMVLLAIQNQDSLYYVPEELKTKEICELAVKNDIKNIQYIPKIYRNDYMKEFTLFFKNKNKDFFNAILDYYDIYTG